MQKKIIALAIAAAISSPAFADVSVANTDTGNITVYATLDGAVGNLQHSQAQSPNFPFGVTPYSAVKTSTANTGSVTGLFNGAVSDSRLGFKGTEDLGDGMKAFFVLETGLNIASGTANNGVASLANGTNEANGNTSLNGQMFDRQAFAGLSDESLGSIQGGLNYNPIVDVLVKYDPVQYADLFSPIGFSGTIGGGGGISENTRVANSLKYKNQFGPINVSAMLRLSGTPNSATGGYAFNVGYEDGDFGVQAIYEAFQDVLKTSAGSTALVSGATITPNINGTIYNTSDFLLAAKYKMGDATIKAGYEHQVLSAASDQQKATSTQVLFGYEATVNTASGVDLPTDVYFIGGDYNFTPTTNLAVGFYNVHNSQAAATTATAAGTSVNSQASSDANYVSILLDHNLSKRTDVYAGAMLSMFSGNAYDSTAANTGTSGAVGYVPAGAAVYNSNLITAVGVRMKF
jgi:GBP family porin